MSERTNTGEKRLHWVTDGRGRLMQASRPPKPGEREAKPRFPR